MFCSYLGGLKRAILYLSWLHLNTFDFLTYIVQLLLNWLLFAPPDYESTCKVSCPIVENFISRREPETFGMSKKIFSQQPPMLKLKVSSRFKHLSISGKKNRIMITKNDRKI